MTIKNFVETTCLVQYPWPVEITHEWEAEFLGNDFKNSLIIKENGIKTKPASPGNPRVNKIIEILHQLLGNIVRTYNLMEIYVYDADPWTGILATVSFSVKSTYHMTKGEIPARWFLADTLYSQ